jgi:hypothetical protein
MGYENLRKPQICKALEKAQAKLAEKAEITKETLVAWLDATWLKVASGEVKPRDGILAVQEINRMLGFYAPSKVNVKGERRLLVIHDAPEPDGLDEVDQRDAGVALPPADPEGAADDQ